MNYYPTISANETTQTYKQSNLLPLTVSYEKRSCLIRKEKEKTNKQNWQKTKQSNIKSQKRTQKKKKKEEK